MVYGECKNVTNTVAYDGDATIKEFLKKNMWRTIQIMNR